MYSSILTHVCVSSAELNVYFDCTILFFLSDPTCLNVVHKIYQHASYFDYIPANKAKGGL